MHEEILHIEHRKPENKIHRRLLTGQQFQEGGMSLLIEAMDTNLMRGVAMKILRDNKNKDEYELSRMLIALY